MIFTEKYLILYETFYMKLNISKIHFALVILIISCACNTSNTNKSPIALKQKLIKVEEDFEALAENKGLAEAFYYYADDSAVIIRKNNTLIKGRASIKKFYSDINYIVSLKWKVDFVDVSNDGTLGYTYGKYNRTVKDEKGQISEVSGIFHTVWKKQKDGSWKYVWD